MRAMSDREYIDAEYPIEDKYHNEFEKYGLGRIKIDKMQMFYLVKKSEEKRLRQQQALFAESDFKKFCQKSNISCVELEKNREARLIVLKNSDGKCPDFLCIKGESRIFVEVKTHTLFTNEVRNKMMSKIIQKKKAAGLSGTTIFDLFDPRPELKGVFGGYLKNASKKFR